MNAQSAKNTTQGTSASLSVKKRLLIFVATYIVVVLIATAIATIPYINHPVAQPDFSWFLGQFIGAILLLPWGGLAGLEKILNTMGIQVDFIRTEGPFPGPSSGLGTLLCLSNYLLFFIIPLAGSLTRKQHTFRILYVVFIALLLINLSGCALV